MNKKAQTEDIFADLIPSLIIIVVGIFVLYYFSYGHTEEIRKNEFMITRVTDRETFSIAGMMNHEISDSTGKKHKLIDLIQEYDKEGKPAAISDYAGLMEGAVSDYLDKVNPKIAACFNIKLSTPLKPQIKLLDMCEMKYLSVDIIGAEKAIIPLQEGGAAEIIIEHGEPLL
jgi:hypothetical protein